jgi:hypothetical protein
MIRPRPADLQRAVAAGLVDATSLAPPVGISEREFTSLVVATAMGLGWRVYHPRPAMERSGRWCTPVQNDVGFPDIALVRDGRLLFIELKSTTGRLSPDQREWLNALGQVPGVTACVMRPSDWKELIRLLKE